MLKKFCSPLKTISPAETINEILNISSNTGKPLWQYMYMLYLGVYGETCRECLCWHSGKKCYWYLISKHLSFLKQKDYTNVLNWAGLEYGIWIGRLWRIRVLTWCLAKFRGFCPRVPVHTRRTDTKDPTMFNS